MFNKIFKYDFRFVFRIWWILAVVTTALSVAGGFFFRGLAQESSSNAVNVLISTIAAIGLITVIVSLCIFPLASIVACLVRYYKNFFSDEGYLTFTLPVQRSTLLNSKILTVFLFGLMSLVAIILDVFLILLIGFPEELPNIYTQIMQEILPAISQNWTDWHTVSAILSPLQIISSAFMSINIMYLSVTIGSIISKNHKVIAGVGFYLGINTLINFFDQIIQAFTVNNLFDTILYSTDLSQIAAPYSGYLTFTLIFESGIGIVAYFINLYCIKRKLNLN